jgi:small conductance mechanosensitive channel
MNLETILGTQIADGVTVGDLFNVDFLATILGNVLAALLIIVAAFVFAGWVKRRIIKISRRHAQLDNTLFSFFANVSRYVILAFSVIFVLNTFGLQTTSLVAAFGAAGLAIGLALQGTLSNLAAGVMIVAFRPIKLDDFVEVGGQMGTVKSISLNLVELATIGNVQVLIPNSQVWGNQIVNYSAYSTRRAEWSFGVSYGTDLAKAEKIILETIMADLRGKSDPEPFIQVNNLNTSSVDFLVRVWVEASDYFAYQADMKRRVKEALDAGGIEIPFPTRTIITAK